MLIFLVFPKDFEFALLSFIHPVFNLKSHFMKEYSLTIHFATL